MRMLSAGTAIVLLLFRGSGAGGSGGIRRPRCLVKATGGGSEAGECRAPGAGAALARGLPGGLRGGGTVLIALGRRLGGGGGRQGAERERDLLRLGVEAEDPHLDLLVGLDDVLYAE